MNRVRLALGAIAVCMAMPVAAAVTTYTFANQTGFTGKDAWDNSSTAWGVDSSGSSSDYGNSRRFMGSDGSFVDVTAWASTGLVGNSLTTRGGYDGRIQSAFVNRYPTTSPNELAVTSRPVSGNDELNTSNNPNTGNNQHAMDNVGAYESLMFAFQSAVTLDKVSIGFPTSGMNLDSDATVLVYTGAGDPTGGFKDVRTYNQLLSNGWQIAGNLLNLKNTGSGDLNLSPSLSSKYWMVGGYMDIGGNHGSKVTVGNDYLKINGLTATPALKVPEPGSLALFGIASLGFVVRRKKGARAV